MTSKEANKLAHTLHYHRKQYLTEWELKFVKWVLERTRMKVPLGKKAQAKLLQIYEDRCAGSPR